MTSSVPVVIGTIVAAVCYVLGSSVLIGQRDQEQTGVMFYMMGCVVTGMIAMAEYSTLKKAHFLVPIVYIVAGLSYLAGTVVLLPGLTSPRLSNVLFLIGSALYLLAFGMNPSPNVSMSNHYEVWGSGLFLLGSIFSLPISDNSHLANYMYVAASMLFLIGSLYHMRKFNIEHG